MSSGAQFGPFEIVRPLGVGGMAETALALRRGEDGFVQRVCLKRVLPAFSADAEFVRAFRAEANLAVHLVHPHVCRLYDFGAEEGVYWMSMELALGGDLRSLFARLQELDQPLPTDIALLLAIDLASALHYAHELVIDGARAELVHRDVSPSNVLLDEHGHFKLADFGIARAATQGHVTKSGVVKGKIPYMAPEHALGQPIDARADLWALGVVLYEAVAGARPFRGVHEIDTLSAICANRRRPVREVAPGAPELLADVIERLLTIDLDARLPSAAAILDTLAPITPPATARLRLAALLKRIRAEPRADAAGPLAAPELERRNDPGLAATRPAPIVPGSEARALSTAPTRTRPLETPRADPDVSPARTPQPPSVAEPGRGAARPAARLTRATVPLLVALLVGGSVAVLGALSLAGGSPVASTAEGPVASTAAPARRDPGLDEGPREPSSAGEPAILETLLPDASARAPGRAAGGAPADAGTVARPSSSAQVGEPRRESDESRAAIGSEPSPAPARGAEARLTVIAVPFGRIWIDGRSVGAGRITRSLEPGRHLIAVGRGEEPTTSETIEIAAGERRSLSIRARR